MREHSLTESHSYRSIFALSGRTILTLKKGKGGSWDKATGEKVSIKYLGDASLVCSEKLLIFKLSYKFYDRLVQFLSMVYIGEPRMTHLFIWQVIYLMPNLFQNVFVIIKLSPIKNFLSGKSKSQRWGSDSVWLWLWHRPAATVQIWPLAWELPYATGMAKKKKIITIREDNNSPNVIDIRVLTPTWAHEKLPWIVFYYSGPSFYKEDFSLCG